MNMPAAIITSESQFHPGTVTGSPAIRRSSATISPIFTPLIPPSCTRQRSRANATTLRSAIDEQHHGGVDGELVVTDQRLIVLDSLMHGAEVIWECPREAVVGARVTGGLGHAGRTVVVFSDGSGIVVLFGVLFRTGAEHFVAEFSRGLEIT